MLSNGSKTNRLSRPIIWATGSLEQSNCRIVGDMQLIRISATRTFLFTLNCRLSTDSWSFSTVARASTFIVPSNSTDHRRRHNVYTLLCMTNTIHWIDGTNTIQPVMSFGRIHHIRCYSPQAQSIECAWARWFSRRASVYVYISVCIERPETKNWH